MDAPSTRHLAQPDYAPAPTMLRRRSTYKLLWILSAIAGGALIVAVAPALLQRIQLVESQRECLNYVGKDVSGDGRYPPLPAAWRSFYFACAGSNLNSMGTVFLHERRTPAGQRRLVAVDVTPRFSSAGALYPHVFEPGSLIRMPREVGTQSLAALAWADFRWQVGIPDPEDSSHFEISYSVNGQDRRIDGWLRDDDSVLLEDRRLDEAASTPTPPPSSDPSRSPARSAGPVPGRVGG